VAGKRVLLAAEFVRGRATLTRLLPLAVALAHRGHEISLAVPLQLAGGISDFPLFDAPRWSLPPPPGYVAISYADVLMHGGYATQDALRDLLSGWRGVLERTTPDLVIADFAPTAMLAGRLAGVRMAAVGDGFSLPPPTSPLPDMRPWADATPDAIDSVEGRVLAVLNVRLGVAGRRDWRHLRDLFDGVPAFLCAFPELDHYVNRAGGTWYGAVYPTSQGLEAVWPAGKEHRVYVDLDPRHPALTGIVDALDRIGLPALIQAAGMPARQADALERRLVQVTTTDNRASLVAGSDIVLCQSLDVAAPALLAGKPVLMLPVFGEQTMTLHRVATQGLGLGLDPVSDVAAIEAAVRRLLDDAACHLRAVAFGRAYDGYQPGIAIDAIADEIDDLVNA
jgi:hypothetical protein